MKWILLPFALIYQFITTARNWAYDNRVFKSVAFDIPVICIGNLAVGGTGKTPHVEFILKRFGSAIPVATLSRGYGRKTKGFIAADNKSSATSIGDEPMQFFKKFGDKSLITVCEDRVVGVPEILNIKPDTALIVLDDAYQHRAIKAGLYILLTDYHNLFSEDYIMPVGRLRESRKSAKRADIIIVTKCPDTLNKAEKVKIEKLLCMYMDEKTSLFFTKLKYGTAKNAQNVLIEGTSVGLISGLANAAPLEKYVDHHFALQKHWEFRDHYRYRNRDLEKINTESGTIDKFITTEKDYVKLTELNTASLLKNKALYYLPIEVEFLEGEEQFVKLIAQFLEQEKYYHNF